MTCWHPEDLLFATPQHQLTSFGSQTHKQILKKGENLLLTQEKNKFTFKYVQFWTEN